MGASVPDYGWVIRFSDCQLAAYPIFAFVLVAFTAVALRGLTHRLVALSPGVSKATVRLRLQPVFLSPGEFAILPTAYTTRLLLGCGTALPESTVGLLHMPHEIMCVAILWTLFLFVMFLTAWHLLQKPGAKWYVRFCYLIGGYVVGLISMVFMALFWYGGPR